jgi:hypothetical protein
LQRATQLGIKVTLNPFIEPYDASENQYFADIPGTNGCTWRGCWNPTGTIRTTFFGQYKTYLEEVATLAQQYSVERMNVGTELNGLDGNSSNIANWSTVINAVDAIYSGPIGYAANWDRIASGNPSVTTQAIFDHPAIDFVGVDSYFTNLVSNTAADASGAYDPNNPFIDTVETAWNNLLATRLLPYAAARRGGQGLPLVFTEFGHLPRNRTAGDPQQQAQSTTQALDTAEQRMAFEGFLNAIDGRQDLIPAVHVWQWAMTGSDGSAWNINPANTGSSTTNTNRDLALWLQAFVGTATLAGDYNADGSVDSADYTAWRDAVGATGGPADGAGSVGERWAWGDPRAALPLRCDWRGAAPPAAAGAELHIATRAGCDAQPVDLALPGEDLRLCSFIWPDQAERLARLRAAMAIARQQQASTGVRVQPLRAAAFVRQQLASRPAGHAGVLMHSVVWQYIDAAEQADITQQMQQAGAAATAQAPLDWLRFEPPRPDQGVELRCRIWPGGADELLAVCHPHATWVHWQAAA